MLRRGISMIRDRRIQTELHQLNEQVSQRDTHASRTDNPHQVTAAQVGAVNKAGDMLTGPLGFRINNATPRYHQNVAAYEQSSSSATGAFVIETPIIAASEPVMMRILVEGYFYDNTSPFFLLVGGYIYSPTPAFYNYGYINLGKKRPLVRWGRNTATGKVVLIIGDVADTYSYPKLWVSLLEGYNPSDNHRTGWSIAQKTSLAGYDLLTTVPDVGAFWHAGNDGAGSGSDMDMLDGYHASYFQPASDERLKADIQPLADALSKVLSLRGVSFVWNDKAQEIGANRQTMAGREIGLLAGEVAQLVPEVVLDWVETPDGEKYKTVDSARIVALLIEAIKELAAKVETLQAQVNALQK